MTNCDCSLAREWARLRRGEMQSKYGVWSCVAIFENIVIDFDSQYRFKELRERAQTAIGDHVCVMFVSDEPSVGISAKDHARILGIEAAIPATLSRRYRIPHCFWKKGSDLLGRSVSDSADFRVSDHDYQILVNGSVVEDPWDRFLFGGLVWNKHLVPPPPPPRPLTPEEQEMSKAQWAELRRRMDAGEGRMNIKTLTVRDVARGAYGIYDDIRRP